MHTLKIIAEVVGVVVLIVVVLLVRFLSNPDNYR